VAATVAAAVAVVVVVVVAVATVVAADVATDNKHQRFARGCTGMETNRREAVR
jgi:hypothetical protein